MGRTNGNASESTAWILGSCRLGRMGDARAVSSPGPEFDHVSGFRAGDWPGALTSIRADSFPASYVSRPNLLAQREDFLLIASVGGTPVAYAHTSPGLKASSCHLRELAVTPSRRGEGLGTALIRETAHWLSPRFGIMYVQAFEDEHHDRRVEWFERLGFRSPGVDQMHSGPLTALTNGSVSTGVDPGEELEEEVLGID